MVCACTPAKDNSIVQAIADYNSVKYKIKWVRVDGEADITDRFATGQLTLTSSQFKWSSFIKNKTRRVYLPPELIRVTVHRAWLEWARFSHYDHQHVQCTYENNLQAKRIQVTVHGA